MRSFFGAILLGAGILIAGLSGLCTVFALGSALLGGMSHEEMTYLPAVLIFAGVPFVIGIGMFFAGRHLIRTADRQDVTWQPTSPPPPQSPASDPPEDTMES